MIHFKENMSQGDAKWILDRAFPIFEYRIAHPTLSILMEAHNKAFEEQVGIPGCSCEYIATHRIWTSRLGQYKSQIEAIANPPIVEEIVEQKTVKPRGRKKNEL